MLTIPENITDFLYWVKERTEAYWSSVRNNPDEANEVPEWIRGAKWIGMKESDIVRIEEKYNVKFTSDHKEFLKILHAIDKKNITTDPENFSEDSEGLFEEIIEKFNVQKSIGIRINGQVSFELPLFI